LLDLWQLQFPHPKPLTADQPKKIFFPRLFTASALLYFINLGRSLALPDSLAADETLTITLYTDEKCTYAFETDNLGSVGACHNPTPSIAIYSYMLTNVPQSFIDNDYIITFGSATCGSPQIYAYDSVKLGGCQLPYGSAQGYYGTPSWAESYGLCDISCIE
jgi:hypothetical protein